MGCTVVGLINVIDSEAFGRYRDAVPATLTPFEGRVVSRGGPALALWDELAIGDLDGSVILDFPTRQHALDWANSEAYKAIVGLRQDSARVSLLVLGD